MVAATKPVRKFSANEFERMAQAGLFGSQEVTLVEGTVMVATEQGWVPRKWTRSEYYRMGELGLFNGQRVELLDGEVIVMSPMGAGHAAAVTKVAHALFRAFGEGFSVRVQLPLALDPTTEPEPDVAVITGSPDDYLDEHPSTAVLIVEVADTSLAYDRTEKARVYARANISEYWIVNLLERQLEVYRKPQGERYAEVYGE